MDPLKKQQNGERRLILILIDGVGIGNEDPAVNPLAAFSPRVLRLFCEAVGPFPGGGLCVQADPRLGVPGLPQSGTNHTTILTGLNAPQLLGRHVAGFPSAQLRSLIGERSIFLELLRAGRRVAFANAYSPAFFEKRPRWVSASTIMCETSGVRLRTLEDLEAGQALYMDLTHRHLRMRGYQVAERSPEEAAEVLARVARRFHLTYFEYFLPDLVAHRGTRQEAERVLLELDEFLYRLVEILPEDLSLAVVSDHGNIEDLSNRGHTLNPVGLLFWGEVREWVARKDCRLSLTDLYGLCAEFLNGH